ncbi:hypothetical protein HYPSUDRAFT_148522 [Hypholoma sublateritium FD-334 SS-4]|uniref:F-box domain-containing protein n=1 Tax=Hypholoma sublateritium (strain FD-334 SS-4) TaxID=945553 RepID=A0A0D2LYG4_HYPSF|nr:hypothetical protein HYPSUDRAFT_148522 [Hypholoma sublateritium FD-334 SS-4]
MATVSLEAVAPVTGNDLPDEIWENIIHYVGASTAYKLSSVNRPFLSFVLSTKYREVQWVTFDTKFFNTLQRLQDPIIGRYVQKLVIRAWFIDLLFKRDMLLKDAPSAEESGIQTMVRMVNNFLFPKAVPPQSLPPQDKSSFEKVGFDASFKAGVLSAGLSSLEIVRMLVIAVNGMANATVLDFEWRDLPLNAYTVVFLKSTRTAFQSSLRRLVLKAQICKFKELLAITDFENIDELDFSFHYQADRTAKNATKENRHVRGIEEFQDAVLPFITHRRHKLRSLSIRSWDTADLSDFFSALPVLPSLRSFSVHLPFDTNTLSEPSSLLSVLKNGKSSLLHISFRGQHRNLQNWSRMNDQLLAHSHYLHNLESLEIPFLALEKTVRLISRSRDTLTRLCLTDKCLKVQDIVAVADVFAHRPFQLRHLRVEVLSIDFALIQTLSRRFPGLTSLVLIVLSFPSGIDIRDVVSGIVLLLVL